MVFHIWLPNISSKACTSISVAPFFTYCTVALLTKTGIMTVMFHKFNVLQHVDIWESIWELTSSSEISKHLMLGVGHVLPGVASH